MTNPYFKNFEEMFEKFLKAMPKEGEILVGEARNKARNYSVEGAVSIGKNYLDDENYLGAMIVFNELSKKDDKIKDVASMYSPLLFAVLNSEVDEDLKTQDFRSKIDDIVTDKIIYCMMESTRMYAEKEIQKEELFNIESLIDKVQFNNMTIKDRVEFQRIYGKFKEYCLDIFIKDKER